MNKYPKIKCDFKAKQKGNLIRHTRIHSKEPKEKPVLHCHVCPKTFQRKDNIKTHVKTHSKVVVCEPMNTEKCIVF